MSDRVFITDVTLRDGLQIEPTIVPTADKIAFGKALIAAGFEELEVGSWVNPKAVPTMADTAEVVAGLADTPATFHTLLMNERGAENAVRAGARNVRLVVSATDGHSKSNAGVPTDEALERIRRAAEILTEAGIRIEGAIATAFVCPFDGDTPVERTARVAQTYIDLGAETVIISDTIGAASPGDVRRVVAELATRLPVERIALHLHDTYGMASASAWAGFALGIRRFDGALGGLGGCPFAPGATGNIASDDLIHMFHREGIDTGVDVDALPALRDRLSGLVGHPLASSLARIPATPSRLRRVA
ncbi:hydroxymethylglutaryl-CoA lyase [Rhodococcoides fascians A25f]|uniref:hydroxymethylglutaryl-CoA lyase n=1 Tax=Rhodococcoides fascians TaxID=1828 RepID=UPI00055CCD00|nr:hydroxymethylglutaryl-CoA lyase [Rhodococcus fascians]QII07291.1 hydroxymethylglutaryl-CoA lyase [Rhodococcus fascians A25f]